MDSLQTLVVPSVDTLVLGRYRLHERLGAGGFGVVWSAYDEQLHREVAVKRIWLQTDGRAARGVAAEQSTAATRPLARDGVAERATREAQATARLSHPAIVALYEAQAQGEAFYLISELVQGDTLGAMLADGELTDEEIVAIGVALTGALEHAHERGVIHRDVKPHNILVPYDPIERAVGVAKLTDFGGALLAGEDVLTRTGDVLGTLAYMAPEQSEGREATAQSDLYSLALVLYEALSGVNPVRGANPADTARRIGGRLPPLRRYRRDLPPGLTAALDSALAAKPAQRGTLGALRQALEDPLEQGLTHSPARLHAQPPAPTRPAPVSPAGLDAPFERPTLRRLCIPRAVWLLMTVALAVWQLTIGDTKMALLVMAAGAPLLVLGRTSLAALTAALAPALGTVGLAGVFPAFAGAAPTWRTRAALGALGYWWLCVAESILDRQLWLGSALAASSLLSVGVLLGAALWALAALLLPWLVRGRHVALDLVAATMWTAALLTAEPMLDHGLPLLAGQAMPRGALVAAILAGVSAVGARALRGPV